MNRRVILNIDSAKHEDTYSIIKVSNQETIDMLHSLLVDGENIDFILYINRDVTRLNDYAVTHMVLDGSRIVIRRDNY